MSNKDGGGVKQQHYLPDKAYLAHFTDDAAKLHCYRFGANRQRFYEAGAKVTDIFGNDIKRWDQDVAGIRAAQPKIYQEIRKIVEPVLETVS